MVPLGHDELTHWGRVMHICISILAIIVSSGRHQAIIWTNAGILLIVHIGTNSEILKDIYTFSFSKNPFENIVSKIAYILSQPQCVKDNKCCVPPGIVFMGDTLQQPYYIYEPVLLYQATWVPPRQAAGVLICLFVTHRVGLPDTA